VLKIVNQAISNRNKKIVFLINIYNEVKPGLGKAYKSFVAYDMSYSWSFQGDH